MAIKSILVPINRSDAAMSALSIGIKMARKYDAHLTGLFCADPMAMLKSGLGAYPQLVEAAQQGHSELKASAKAAYDKKVATDAGDLKDRLHWIEAERDPDTGVMEYARYADITVVGAEKEGFVREETSFHADNIALISGRPVLVVPTGYDTDVLVEHAVVAWDGKRAAARALGDAMQILENKAKVTVLTVGDRLPDVEPGLDIAEHLRRHGIEPEMVAEARQGRSVADAIVDYCRDSGAGILVMGAYEHSKFSEDLFGGVTNHVIRRCPIPVLMAH